MLFHKLSIAVMPILLAQATAGCVLPDFGKSSNPPGGEGGTGGSGSAGVTGSSGSGGDHQANADL